MYDECGTYLDMPYEILQEYLNYLDMDITNSKNPDRKLELENFRVIVVKRLNELNEYTSSLQS